MSTLTNKQKALAEKRVMRHRDLSKSEADRYIAQRLIAGKNVGGIQVKKRSSAAHTSTRPAAFNRPGSLAGGSGKPHIEQYTGTKSGAIGPGTRPTSLAGSADRKVSLPKRKTSGGGNSRTRAV